MPKAGWQLLPIRHVAWPGNRQGQMRRKEQLGSMVGQRVLRHKWVHPGIGYMLRAGTAAHPAESQYLHQRGENQPLPH